MSAAPGVLPDSNVLIALAFNGHVHHAAAETWLAGLDDRFATCPITEGSLVREIFRSGHDATTALSILSTISELPRHEFWPDDLSYGDVRLAGVVGHRQVTDAYLAQLARQHGGRVASFDRGFVALHGDVAELVPVGG
jgi:toxin-antitoxin system PIN domain toxin